MGERGRPHDDARAPLPALLLITDAAQAARHARGVVETVTRALARPCPDVGVLVRARGEPLEAVEALCRALLPVARRASAALLVHTHAALVAPLGLDGVHLASADDVAAARAQLPRDAWLGASRHAGDALERFEGLDYATMSPVFPPTSKPDDVRTTLGLDGLAAEVARAPVPLFALGGVTRERAGPCARRGARIAVLGDVMGAHDPAAALAQLRDALARAEVTRG